MKINCIIIEDEPLAAEKLAGFIREVKALNLLASFDNAIDALGFIKTNKIDLMFLDIQMAKLTGIQMLENMQQKPQVIIVSAYDQYALKGYEFNVTDFLLKPYSFDRFLQAADRAMELHHLKFNNRESAINLNDDVLFIKSGNKIEKITLHTILFIQGMKDYQLIVSENSKTMTLQNLKTIEETLPSKDFCRVHKSYIISINKIENIERNRIKIQDHLIPISETYKEHFFNQLKQKKNLI